MGDMFGEYQVSNTHDLPEEMTCTVEAEIFIPKLVSVRPNMLPAPAQYKKCPLCKVKRAKHALNMGKYGCKHDFHGFFGPKKKPQNITYSEARREALRILCSKPHGWVYKYQECRPSNEKRSPIWYGKRLNKYMSVHIAKYSSKWLIMLNYKFATDGTESIKLAEATSMLGEYRVNAGIMMLDDELTCTVEEDEGKPTDSYDDLKATSPDSCRVLERLSEL